MSAFIDEHRDHFGVEPICQTLDVSASAYYQRKTGERSDRSVEDERLTGRIREVHGANYECYGYRRVHAQLVREGEAAGRDWVARLMASHGIQGAKRAGSRGGRRSPIRRRSGRLIWSAVISPPRRLTACGSETSPTCARGRAGCSSRS